MPFNVNNFKTSLRDFGYVDNNSFIVYVQPPKVLGGDNPGISKNLSFRIDQVRAPGISLITNDINRDRKSTRLNSSHIPLSRMPSSA